MKLVELTHDPETCRITVASLKMLRDAIAHTLYDRIAVLQLDTGDLTCGFLILDRDTGIGVWSGDGFRTDRAGEGGAGYRTAQVIFRLFGIDLIYFDFVDISEYEDKLSTEGDEEAGKFLLETMAKIALDVEDSEFKKPLDSNPEYIR